MSASDKKKQRKEGLAEGLTQRQRKEQADAQAAKQKKTLYTVLGVVCAVGAAAVLIWHSAFWEKGAVAANVDGTAYKTADLQYYYAKARNTEANIASFYAQLGFANSYDVSLSDGEQWYNESENKTYADYFRETALSSLKQTALVCKAAKEAGYTLSEKGQQELKDTLSDIDAICAQYNLTRNSWLVQAYGSEVKEKVFIRNLTNDILSSEYQDYYASSLTYSDEDLNAYYEENKDNLDSFTYRIFNISADVPSTTDSEGNTVEATEEEKEQAMEDAKARADAAVKEIEEAGDKEKAFLAAAPKYAADSDKETYKEEDSTLRDKLTGSTVSSNDSTAASWLKDAARKAGDVTAIEGSSSYQVVLFLNRELVQESTVNIRHILIKAELTQEDNPDTEEDESQIPTQEAMDAAKAEAEKLMEEWKKDPSKENFAKLANENSDDPGSNTNGGEYTYVYRGQMFSGFDEWIFDPARKNGDIGLVENTNSNQQGWHLIYFDEDTGTPYWKHTAIEAKQSSDKSEWLNGLLDAATAEAADGMKYVGDKNTAVATATASPAGSEAPTESEAPAESETPTESESPAESETPAESESPAVTESAAAS